MPSIDSIAQAIAARYASGTLTPPGGLEATRFATADLPAAIPDTPGVLVFADEGTLDPGNGTRLSAASFLVRFYYAEAGDLERDQVALRDWLDVLINAHLAAMQLGGLVAAVRTRRWKLGQLPYAGRTYNGVELTVEAISSEGWSPTA